MFIINDSVVYGNEGVCLITDIVKKEFNSGLIDYYLLKPVSSPKSSIYIPINNTTLLNKIHPLISTNEIVELINSMPEKNTIWIEDNNNRREEYKKIIYSGDRIDLIKLIKTLYLKREDLKTNKKKLLTSDDNFFKSAEKILYDEFAYVLDIKPDEVRPYIEEQLRC